MDTLSISHKNNISRNIEDNKKRQSSEIPSVSTSISFSSIDINDKLLDNHHQNLLFNSSNVSKSFILKLQTLGRNTHSSYLSKLICKNLFNRKEKKFNNIFIFDWDDTLFCTSVLSPNGYFDESIEISDKTLERIEKLEIYVNSLLSKALEKGDTYIITNSELAWIDYSCQRFFPSVYELIDKIKIISARDLYEEKYPNDYKIWKIKAFNDIVKNYALHLPTNIMSFGDSSYEIDAAFDMISNFKNGFIKAIKFKEYPLISDIINQLIILLEKFDILYQTCRNFTININE